MNYESQYLRIMEAIMRYGRESSDRTGTGTKSLFGEQMKIDLRYGALPLLTTKKIHIPSVVHELLWFISGSTNTKYLRENGVTIWDGWADQHGELGPVYGHQWRNFDGTVDGEPGSFGEDQLAESLNLLVAEPSSRRNVVSAWNPNQIRKMALAPCHMSFQFRAYPGKEEGDKWQLSCHMYQRSADWFLGVPFNMASYAFLTHMVAHVVGMEAESLVMSFGDCHLYNNHLDQASLQMSRSQFYLKPELFIKRGNDPRCSLIHNLTQIRFEDLDVRSYNSHPAIKAPISI